MMTEIEKYVHVVGILSTCIFLVAYITYRYIIKKKKR